MRRAQRLTASLESSQQVVPFIDGLLDVLNALQRLGNLHTAGNARILVTYVCSTPHGVLGIFTSFASNSIAPFAQCSTPNGVTGIFADHAKFIRFVP